MMGMQEVPGAQSDLGQARIARLGRPPLQLRQEAQQQGVQGALADDAQLWPTQDVMGPGHRAVQLGLVHQGPGEARFAQRPGLTVQALQLARQPLGIEVEHGIGEALGFRRLAVVQLARLQQKDLPRGTQVALATAVELLDALLGVAHQIGVVPVRVIGMALEMGAQGLDAGVGVLLQLDPVIVGHGEKKGICGLSSLATDPAPVWKIRAA